MKTLNPIMIDVAYIIQKDCQDYCQNKSELLASAIKEDWPKETGVTLTTKVTAASEDIKETPGYGITEYVFNLKHAALRSRDICLVDLARVDFIQREKIFESIIDEFKGNLKWFWEQTFRNDFIQICENHIIRARFSNEHYCNCRRLNIFGKEISDLTRKSIIRPSTWKAAEQIIEFAPDTVHFLFPESREWIGKFKWINIGDAETNPRSEIGHFRVILTYAAKPVRPYLGRVITIAPWITRMIWKLCRFNP